MTNIETGGNTNLNRSISINKHKKRARRNNFLANAKGFGKKGYYGRGSEIKDDQFTYFINILDTIKAGFQTMDDKVTMANNVFEQTTDEEIHLSSNQIVSKAIESLIGFTSVEHFERFQKAFSDLRPICSNNFASHVLQKMVEIAFLRAVGYYHNSESTTDDSSPAKKAKIDLSEKEYNTRTKFSSEHKKTCSEFVLKVGKFLLNNLEDFLWDPYANHIMRTSVSCLSGIYSNKVAFEHATATKLHSTDCYEVPAGWHEVVLEYANRLQLWPHFPDFPNNELSSAMMASLCVSLKRIDKNVLKHLGKKILFEAFLKADEGNDKKKIDLVDDDENQQNEQPEKQVKLPKVFERASSIRLLETLLIVAGPKLFTQLYAMLFTGRLKTLGLNRMTNFAVQKLIENIKEKVDFETIFTELSDHIEELIKVGHTGVVSALSTACLRLVTKQGAFITALKTALHITEAKDSGSNFYTCLLKLKSSEEIEEDKSQFVHIHGSLIIQSILQFNKPIYLVNCILETPSDELAAGFSTPNGSYIADAFLASKFIGEKSREKLIRHLKGSYLDMAVTKFGSRVVENLFEAASEGQKCKIAKELVDKANQLNGTMFGRVLFHKFRLETFRLSQTQWKTALSKTTKAEKLFKDILAK